MEGLGATLCLPARHAGEDLPARDSEAFVNPGRAVAGFSANERRVWQAGGRSYAEQHVRSNQTANQTWLWLRCLPPGDPA